MSEPNSAYDDILQDLANALAREQGLLAELRHANGTIAEEIQRLRAALEAVVAHEESLGGGLCGWSTTFHIAARALAGKKGEKQL